MAGFVKVLSAADLADGVPKVIWFRQREVVLVRLGPEVFAMDNGCPHRAAPLSAGKVDRGELVCPLHGWRIRLADGECRERPGNPHTTYQVRLEGDQVLLAV